MDIIVRESGDIRIIDLKGRLDTGTSPTAESAINKILDEGCQKLAINLSGTDYISSSGLRVLLATAKKISTMKGKFKICQPNEVVKEILDISGFSTILDVRGSEDEALSELQL